jgi:peptidoglycan/xylan/chitin deacetylase (PgdA/CDA1 family)
MPPFTRNPIIRLAKFLVSAAFYSVRETLGALSRLLGRRQPGQAIVIYYHQVLKEERERFARQMDHLLRWTEPIRADHIGSLTPRTRYAMVTVDDGWMSFVENALPELRSRNIPVTMFVVADRMGNSMGEPVDHILSEEELRGLAPDIERGLVTIGSHTSTHARLTELTRREVWRELAGSRTRMEQILDRKVNLFCFPFGIYSAETIELCRAAGYERLFGGLPAPALRDPHESLIGRTRVDPSDWLFEFHLKLMGAYGWVPLAAELKRRILDACRAGRGRHVDARVRPRNPDSMASQNISATSSK